VNLRKLTCGNAIRMPTMHKAYCFAGQPATCLSYFTNDVLACVCGVNGNVLSALSQIVIPAVPLEQTTSEIHLVPLSA
jgi:hypothetical protein